MTAFSNTKTPITIEQIKAIEEFAGLDFPTGYKNHLLQYNGGQCEPNSFQFEENGTLTDSFVDWFLAIHDGPYNNLKEYITIYKIEEKRLPKHILPIAHDPGGNLICISCDSKDNEHIYFWDHEKEENEVDDSNYDNLKLIATGFNQFLNQLYD